MTVVRVVKPRVSYTDLTRYPEDGRRYELYDGEVFVVPSPLPIHQIVADNLSEILRAYAKRTGGISITAPLDIVFSEFDVLQPDVVFFTAARRGLIRLDQPIRHAPDLAVEVLSPSTAAADRGRKMQMFARYGVREYWIADPAARAIELYSLEDAEYALVQTASVEDIVQSPSLPGLEFSLRDIFPTN